MVQETESFNTYSTTLHQIIWASNVVKVQTGKGFYSPPPQLHLRSILLKPYNCACNRPATW